MATQPIEEEPGRPGGHGGDLAVLLERVAAAQGGVQGMGAGECLEVLEALHRLSGVVDAVRVDVVAELAARTGEDLLARAGVSEPAELSATGRERWRARCKSVAAAEVSALTGMGRWRARQLVAIALAPKAVAGPVREGLVAGVATWGQVEHFWRRAGGLPHEHAADVATALFATGTTADKVAVERLRPGGGVSTEAWPAKVYVEALEREVTRAQGRDPAADAAHRAEVHRGRCAYGVIDDDGTGQVVITGDAASTAACVDRLHVLARRARLAGDERTESQLRSDIGRALLLHGTLALPDLAHHQPQRGDDGGDQGCDQELASLVTPEDIASLAQIISGTPTYDLQVVVPWDATTNASVLTARSCRCGGGTGPSGNAVLGKGVLGEGADPSPLSSTVTSDTPPGRVSTPSWPPDLHSPPDMSPAARGEVVPGVGRLVGRFPRFFTTGQIRDMVLASGTTLHRLLTDPADGRCLERTLARYTPDAAMRTQVMAADLLSRAPGQTLPVRDGQLDHVHEYLLGGPTCEANLQGLDTVFHALKTQKFWHAEIDATRQVTWTSFFDRIYRTRAHDYTQYLATGTTHVPDAGAESAHVTTDLDAGGEAGTQGPGHAMPTDPGTRPVISADARRHLASLLVYAALAARQAGAPLEACDDDPDSDTDLTGPITDTHRSIQLRHRRTRDHRRTPGPHPGTPTPEHLIQHTPDTLLAAEHWTDPYTGRGTTSTASSTPNADTTDDTHQTWRDQPPPF